MPPNFDSEASQQSEDETDSSELDDEAMGCIVLRVENEKPKEVSFETFADCFFVINKVWVDPERKQGATVYVKYLNEKTGPTTETIAEFAVGNNSVQKIMPLPFSAEEKPVIGVNGCNATVRAQYFKRSFNPKTGRPVTFGDVLGPDGTFDSLPPVDWLEQAEKEKTEEVPIVDPDTYRFEDAPDPKLPMQRRCAMLWDWFQMKSRKPPANKRVSRTNNEEVKIGVGIQKVFEQIRNKVYTEAERGQYAQMFQAVFDALDTFSKPFDGLREVISYLIELLPSAVDASVSEKMRLAAYRVGWARIKEILQPEFIEEMFNSCRAMTDNFLKSKSQRAQEVIKELCTVEKEEGFKQRFGINDKIDWAKEEPWEKLAIQEPAPPKKPQTKVSKKQPKKSSKPKQSKQSKKTVPSSSDEDDSPSEDGHDAGDDGEFAPKEN